MTLKLACGVILVQWAHLFFLRPTIHIDVTHILTLFSEHLKQFYALFRVSFCGTIKRRGLWPVDCSPNLNSRDFYLWCMLKDKKHRNNPRTQHDRKKSTQEEGSSILLAEIRRAMNNAFVRCDTYVRAEGNHFHQHL
jgi:hypothetical protein